MAEPNLVLGWFAAFVGAVGFGSFAVSFFFSVTVASLIYTTTNIYFHISYKGADQR